MFYMHYDIGNIIDDHIVYQIKAYAELGIEIIFISNNQLSDAELEKIRPFCIKSILHHNKGFDFTAWKDAILAEGWDFFNNYDQLIITNCSCYGPIYPFEEMFNEMDKRDPDWWGITERSVYLGFNNYVISNFAAFSKRVFTSRLFRNFWTSVKSEYKSYWEVIRHGEMRMSEVLNKQFKYDIYCRLSDIRPCKKAVHEECFYTNAAGFFLKTTRSPLLKVKGFANSRENNFCRSDEIFRLWEKSEISYPLDLIIKHQKRVSPLSWLRNFPDVFHITDDEINTGTADTGIFFKINSIEDISLYNNCLQQLPFEIKIAVPSGCAAQISTGSNCDMKIIPNELQKASWGEILFKLFPDFADSKKIILAADIRKNPDLPDAVNSYIISHSCRAMLGSAGRINKIASLLENDNALAVSPMPSDLILTEKVPYLNREDFQYLQKFAGSKTIPLDRSMPTVMVNFCYITCDALKNLHSEKFFSTAGDSAAKLIAYALQIQSKNTIIINSADNLKDDYFHYHDHGTTLLRTDFKKHLSATIELAGKACINFYHSILPTSFTHRMMYLEEPLKKFLKKFLGKK